MSNIGRATDPVLCIRHRQQNSKCVKVSNVQVYTPANHSSATTHRGVRPQIRNLEMLATVRTEG